MRLNHFASNCLLCVVICLRCVVQSNICQMFSCLCLRDVTSLRVFFRKHKATNHLKQNKTLNAFDRNTLDDIETHLKHLNENETKRVLSCVRDRDRERAS